MCKEYGQPLHAATPEVRKKWGLKIWEQGEITRPGKTQRDHESGAWARRLTNRYARTHKS
jgi:hypothetical protein